MLGHREILDTRSLRSARDELRVIQRLTDEDLTARDIQRGTNLKYDRVARLLTSLQEAHVVEKVPASHRWRLVELLE
jgi:DNA-binding IclR family transcriptional regulator